MSRVDELRELVALMKDNKISSLEIDGIKIAMASEEPPPRPVEVQGEVLVHKPTTAYEDRELYEHLGIEDVPLIRDAEGDA